MSEEPDRIAQLFADKTVLITGATGFVGKILLEKILRSCSGVRKVYVLVRKSGDVTASDRLNEMLEGPLFQSIKSQNCLEKIEAVSGDLAADRLRVKPSVLKRVGEEVDVIYHCAANTELGVPLKDSVCINVRGTKHVLELAKSCKNLRAFVHVSTAFCHLDQEILLEDTIDIPIDPNEVINLCDYFSWEIVEKLKEEILGGFPDCYYYTKALSENLVARAMDDLPVVIVRPSLVTPILREPIPGYYDKTSDKGFLVGYGTGLIRTLYCRKGAALDYIPADILANVLLFSTYDFIVNKNRRVYNAVASKKYKVPMDEVVKIGQLTMELTPLKRSFWCPGGTLAHCRFLHNCLLVSFQLLPALVMDTMLILFRIKPYFMDVYNNALNTYALCDYCVNRNWNFDCSQSRKALRKLNGKERSIYNFEGIENMREYFSDCIRAAKLYTEEDVKGLLQIMAAVYEVLLAGIFMAIFYWTVCVLGEDFM